ncbi:hypothetical protein UPYG_G00101910 [Umbra pygmaea]|uniref:Uncharacterized protein n=1 Tax=Umbra pygmaea TaxID=75934 RepID=A0ABD0XNH5_UMBPY
MDLTGYGTYRHPDCALIIFGGDRGQKKGEIGGKARDFSVVTGPPTCRRWSGLSRRQRVREKRRSIRLKTGVSCQSSGIVTKPPFTLRGALKLSQV